MTLADRSEADCNDRDEAARAAAMDFGRRLAPRWQEMLGADLLGVYMIGSAAHAGFSARYSDIDVALVTEDGLLPDMLDRLRGGAVAASPDLGPKVSVFWTDRKFSCGRFPPLDRVDYLDYAIVLLERERVLPARPPLAEIRHYLGGAPFTGWVERARKFATAAVLERKDQKAYLRTHLYPARLCYSWITGRMGSNDEAVAFLIEQKIAGLDMELIKRALQCRLAGADPDPLFPARTRLPAQVNACTALLASPGGA